MGIFIAYMIKSGFCLLLFYLLYKWQLAKETFFRLNRIMLLGFWILAFLLPAIPLVNWGNTDLPAGLDVNRPEILNSLTNISLSAETNTDHQAFIWTWLICTGYIVGVVLIASKQLVSWTRLYLLIRRGRHIENGPFHLILIEGNQPPFSWMHYIILSEKDYRENPTEILTHEMAHIRHHHSWDLLLADIGILLHPAAPPPITITLLIQSPYSLDSTHHCCKLDILPRFFPEFLMSLQHPAAFSYKALLPVH